MQCGDEPDDVWVIKVREILNLAEHFDCVAVLGIFNLHDFDGVNSFIQLVPGLDYSPKAAGPQLIQHVKLCSVPLNITPIGRQHLCKKI